LVLYKGLVWRSKAGCRGRAMRGEHRPRRSAMHTTEGAKTLCSGSYKLLNKTYLLELTTTQVSSLAKEISWSISTGCPSWDKAAVSSKSSPRARNIVNGAGQVTRSSSASLVNVAPNDLRSAHIALSFCHSSCKPSNRYPIKRRSSLDSPSYSRVDTGQEQAPMKSMP